MELKLRARRPRWWEKKWKPKKPTLYILEIVDGEWVHTYWWGGCWRGKSDRMLRFHDSGTVRLDSYFRRPSHVWLVVGRSGTTLTVDGPGPLRVSKIKSLNPNTSEWTCFGKIDRLGDFEKEVSRFDLIEKIKSKGL